MDLKLLTEGLVALIKLTKDEFDQLIKQMGLLPNINFPTMGGRVFWNDLAEVNGWRVQKNNITGHCRILDANDVRRAWGEEEAIMKFFQKRCS